MAFTKKTHMYRHIRNSCKIAPNVRNGTDGMERLYTLIKEKEKRDSSALTKQVAPIQIDARGANLNTTINIIHMAINSFFLISIVLSILPF